MRPAIVFSILVFIILVVSLAQEVEPRSTSRQLTTIAPNTSLSTTPLASHTVDSAAISKAANNTKRETISHEEEAELEDEEAEDEEEDDDDEEEDDDDDEQEAVNQDDTEPDGAAKSSGLPAINRLDSKDGHLTQLIKPNNRLPRNKARDLGLLTIKAILLGPLIGLTIKAALIRGLLYAILAYTMHLFFPSLLSTVGLGTGLVGFARQLQPNYAQMLLPHLANLQHALPGSFTRLASQYQQVLSPVIESIRSIPEGHCRYRAVCETASQLIRQSRSMSPTLQRISATVYTNFGSDYSKAWLDGVVQSDCAAKYPQCPTSPFSMVAGRLAQALGAGGGAGGMAGLMSGMGAAGFGGQYQVPISQASASATTLSSLGAT